MSVMTKLNEYVKMIDSLFKNHIAATILLYVVGQDSGFILTVLPCTRDGRSEENSNYDPVRET